MTLSAHVPFKAPLRKGLSKNSEKHENSLLMFRVSLRHIRTSIVTSFATSEPSQSHHAPEPLTYIRAYKPCARALHRIALPYASCRGHDLAPARARRLEKVAGRPSRSFGPLCWPPEEALGSSCAEVLVEVVETCFVCLACLVRA